MWLRTTLNYQYRYGTTTIDALKKLYNEGGIARLYQGLPFAMLQGPLSRFGDTASNTFVVAAIEAVHLDLPTFLTTLAASLLAGSWRVALMPIDTVKTSMQVNGASGLDIVKERIALNGWTTLFAGAVAASAATVVGHYPWFLTYNLLSDSLPSPNEVIANAANHASSGPLDVDYLLAQADPRLLQIMRSAFIGLCASSVSDICSNSLRVLKTTRQSDTELVSYAESAKAIVQAEGLGGLFGRGLQTRLLANSMQSVLFSVFFKLFQQSSQK
jgi:hypothetical protein